MTLALNQMNIPEFQTEDEYKAALERCSVLFSLYPDPESPQGEELVALAFAAEHYEELHYGIEREPPVVEICFRCEQEPPISHPLPFNPVKVLCATLPDFRIPGVSIVDVDH